MEQTEPQNRETVVADGDRSALHLTTLRLMDSETEIEKGLRWKKNPTNTGWRLYNKLFGTNNAWRIVDKITYRRAILRDLELMTEADIVRLHDEETKQESSVLKEIEEKKKILRQSRDVIIKSTRKRCQEKISQIDEQLKNLKKQRC